MPLRLPLPLRYLLQASGPTAGRVLLLSLLFQGLHRVLGEQLPHLPLKVPLVLGGALLLLLALAMQRATSRWRVARCSWGSIVCDARGLVLQFANLVPLAARDHSAAGSALRTLAYRQMAWGYCLGRSLRGLDPLATLAPYLSAGELAGLRGHTNKPLALLALHAAQLRALTEQHVLHPVQAAQLEATVGRLRAAMFRVQRLRRTAPAEFTAWRWGYGSAYLLLAALSLSLVPAIGLWEMPVLLLTAAGLFGLARTTRARHDPFGHQPSHRPITVLARTVTQALREVLWETEPPQPAAVYE